MTITHINRVREFRDRMRRITSPRESDTPLYLHHCERCGFGIDTDYVNDFIAHCPQCSEQLTDHRIFRWLGDPPEDRAENVLVAALVLLACWALLAAFLVVIFPY